MDLATPPVIVAGLATASSLALAVAGALLGRPGWIKWSFVFGMAMFGVEAFTTVMLRGAADLPSTQLFWLKIREGARIGAPLGWTVFVGALTRHHTAPLPRPWKVGVGAGVLITVGLFAAVWTVGAMRIPVYSGSFFSTLFGRAVVTDVGVGSAALQLILTLATLAGLEACLRTSRGPKRRRAKFLVLGLGGILLIRFYWLSQLALFRTITTMDLDIEAVTLLIGNAVLAVGLARSRWSDMQLAVSPVVVYRSVTFLILGSYLLAIGGLGWLLNYLQIPEQAFWVTVGVFVSALALAAILLSERAQWRAKRFISRYVYRTKYDYREQWITFTRRLGTLLTVDDLSRELLEVIREAVGSTGAILYIADDRNRTYHVAGALWIPEQAPSVTADDPSVAALATADGPTILDSDLAWGGAALARAFPAGSAMVPLRWGGRLIGFFVLGPERTGMPYTPEDVEFMSTMAQQAAGAIVTAQLSESMARDREFEALARVASFVVHDLKNLTAGLSLLSQNAVKYLDDPQFQKDAVLSLARTVDRMQALLARLSSRAEPLVHLDQDVDVAQVVREAVETIAAPNGVSVLTELERVPVVRGDSEALGRLVLNLVNNAVQAVSGPGTIIVTVKLRSDAVILAVADTGCGMSEEFIRESLFVPFRTTKRGGWGIGLYQVKEIVERHGGTLAVTSREGQGTTFEIALPSIK